MRAYTIGQLLFTPGYNFIYDIIIIGTEYTFIISFRFHVFKVFSTHKLNDNLINFVHVKFRFI